MEVEERPRVMTTEVSAMFRIRLNRDEIIKFVLETAFVFGIMIVYFLIRGGLPVRAADAFERANQVIQLEQRLGFFVELQWQEKITDSETMMKLANWVYVWGHLPVLIFAAVWMYVRNRPRYRVYRNALILSGFVGLIGYALFPMAPPRLLPEWGFVDTVAAFTKENYEMQPEFFINHYAAVPSLHFGWALLIGIGLIDADKSLFIRAFAVVSTVAMFFGIVLTANHFLFDMIVGSAIVLLALAVAQAFDSGFFRRSRLSRQQAQVSRTEG